MQDWIDLADTFRDMVKGMKDLNIIDADLGE